MWNTFWFVMLNVSRLGSEWLKYYFWRYFKNNRFRLFTSCCWAVDKMQAVFVPYHLVHTQGSIINKNDPMKIPYLYCNEIWITLLTVLFLLGFLMLIHCMMYCIVSRGMAPWRLSYRTKLNSNGYNTHLQHQSWLHLCAIFPLLSFSYLRLDNKTFWKIKFLWYLNCNPLIIDLLFSHYAAEALLSGTFWKLWIMFHLF